MTVTLYGAEWCPACNQAKKYLKDKNIEYTYIAVDTEEGLVAAKNNLISSIPVLDIDNKKIVGYSLNSYNLLFSNI